MSRLMGRWYAEMSDSPKTNCSSPLQPELLADDPRDLLAVGAAARLLHHVADDHADRLHVAALQLLRHVGVGGQRPLDDGPELVAAADRGEALALDDRRGVAALGRQALEHLTARVVRDLTALDHADERGESAGLDLG